MENLTCVQYLYTKTFQKHLYYPFIYILTWFLINFPYLENQECSPL